MTSSPFRDSLVLHQIGQCLTQVCGVHCSHLYVGAGVGKIDCPQAHQVCGSGLCVGVRPDQPCIRLRFDNGSATWSRGLNALIELIRCLQFQVSQGIDLDGPLHCRLGGSIRHVHHVQYQRRCGSGGRNRTVKSGVCASSLGYLIRVTRKQHLLQLLCGGQGGTVDRYVHQVLNLVVVTLKCADQSPCLVDQVLRPDHSLLKLLHGFVHAQNLVQSTSNHFGQRRLNARQPCHQQGATWGNDLGPCRPRRREHKHQGENDRPEFMAEHPALSSSEQICDSLHDVPSFFLTGAATGSRGPRAAASYWWRSLCEACCDVQCELLPVAVRQPAAFASAPERECRR